MARSARLKSLERIDMLFKKRKAQSFVEFALVLPLLLLVLLGVVELVLFLGTYINLLDLTRESARFASNRDPNAAVTPTQRTCTNPTAVGNTPAPDKPLDFFYDTSCIFSPLQGSTFCAANDPYCNGFNSTVQLKKNLDDVLIYVFTESQSGGAPTISNNSWCKTTDAQTTPSFTNGTCPWVWSNNQLDGINHNNWLHKCGTDMSNTTATRNFYPALVQSYLSTNTLLDKAFVVVEVYFCYQQVLNIPILSKFLPNPMVIDTYSIMPLPAAQPTLIPPTPIPSATP